MSANQSTEKAVQELREEVSKLRGEIKTISDSLIFSRIKDVERAIVQNHLKLYAKQAKDVLDDTINLSLRNTCKNRQNCEQKFKSSTERILKSCEEDALKKVFVKLDEELDLVGDALKKAADRPCASCYNELKSLLRKHRENIRRIAGLEADAEGEAKELAFDVTRIVETVMKPLSNPARLTILTSLHQGRTSFQNCLRKQA